MVDNTDQMNTWEGEFGRLYTDRNPRTQADVDDLYLRNFGMTRTQLNEEFLTNFDRDIKILEVGANVGAQLQILQQMGFRNLYGIELQMYAVERAKNVTSKINLIQGNAFDIPFKDGFFDLVYTSGVLIHISPSDILNALKEIYRCSRHYIWGFEYFSEKYVTVQYRGQDDLLWKTNFARLYQSEFSDLALVADKKVPYLDDNNTDYMFLLEKNN